MNKHTTALVMLLGLSASSLACAKPQFPKQIMDHLSLNREPTCLICHGSKLGGGPVVQPFGLAMLAAGLTAAGNSTLKNALDKLDSDKTDSNDDGIADIQGLREGIEPLPSKPAIEYGCGSNSIAPSRHLAWSASLAALATLALLSRRTGRQAPKARAPRCH